MSVSVWEEKSKRDIDQATEKIVKLISAKRYTFNVDNENPERQKNQDFLDKYQKSIEIRNLILSSLQPESCGDVRKKDENDDLMYVYFVEQGLYPKGCSLRTKKKKVSIYIKVEICKNAVNSDYGLVISFHEKEFDRSHYYDQLPEY